NDAQIRALIPRSVEGGHRARRRRHHRRRKASQAADADLAREAAMTKRRSHDPLALEIARDMEKRGFHIDVESVEATVAKFRAAEQDERYALIDSSLTLIERLTEAWQATFADPAAVQRTRRAAVLRREVYALAAKLKRRGVRNPVTQAKEEVAER